MKLFGVQSVMALDHSSWETADIIHDLYYALPELVRLAGIRTLRLVLVQLSF